VAQDEHVRSFQLNADGPERHSKRTTSLSLGLGLFEISFEGHTLFALHQTVGEPVATSSSARMMRTLTLLTPGLNRRDVLQAYGDALLAAADQTDQSAVSVYRWLPKRSIWVQDAAVAARPISSVVLPEATKAPLLADVDEFVHEETAGWYRRHGIPMKVT
jgi:hypothetical protein